ncbi:hypothetical protein [Ligilactobacillus apodemi]|uniref:hypothetical protein n=1 Tax=Ligilactobacillus apodemi TaxID=307126 RepID=UPI001F33675D|nr:hypothetical protein [Ligilactobacillus apodemi]
MILLGQLSLLLFSLAPVIYLFSLLYGMGYGALFKVFYVGIGRFESLAERNMGFSIIGLISYLGVGIAPVFLIPFSGAGWTKLFCGNLFYSCIGMILFVFLWKKV